MNLSISFAQDLSHEVKVILRIRMLKSWKRSESLSDSTWCTQRGSMYICYKVIPSTDSFRIKLLTCSVPAAFSSWCDVLSTTG